MAGLSLSPTSYLVLGLVAHGGEVTPYDLKQMVAVSVGNFWSFPHSQLYAEPARLARAGLLDERQEQHGRRRKLYRITGRGQEALDAWLAEPEGGRAEMRDTALLQLFFSGDRPATARAIAEVQLEAHRRQLGVYEELAERVRGSIPESQLATLELGMRYERLSIEFWSEVCDQPPGAGGDPRWR